MKKESNNYSNGTHIIRADHDLQNTYTKISSDLINDQRLSLIELGIMTKILNNADTYILHKNYLKKIAGIGKVQFDKAFKNLERFGYVVKITHSIYHYYIINENPSKINISDYFLKMGSKKWEVINGKSKMGSKILEVIFRKLTINNTPIINDLLLNKDNEYKDKEIISEKLEFETFPLNEVEEEKNEIEILNEEKTDIPNSIKENDIPEEKKEIETVIPSSFNSDMVNEKEKLLKNTVFNFVDQFNREKVIDCFLQFKQSNISINFFEKILYFTIVDQDLQFNKKRSVFNSSINDFNKEFNKKLYGGINYNMINDSLLQFKTKMNDKVFQNRFKLILTENEENKAVQEDLKKFNKENTDIQLNSIPNEIFTDVDVLDFF